MADSKSADVAEMNGWTRFVSMQNHYNLIYREEEREMMPLCLSEKIGVIPYSPLASGRLTRDWSETTHRSETDMVQKSKYDATADADRVIVERVAEIAAERGIPRVQVALAWLLQNNRLQHLSLVRPKFRISKMQQLLFGQSHTGGDCLP